MTARFDQGPWAAAGVQTVQPGVHRVPLPLPNDGLHAVNVYLLENLAEDDGIVMIDGGWAIPEARKALEEAMAAIGRDLSDISHILVTHIHRDHYTNAVELRRLLGSRVYLGAGERPGLEMLDRLRSDVPAGSLRTLRGRVPVNSPTVSRRWTTAATTPPCGRPPTAGSAPRPSASATGNCGSCRPPDTPRDTWSSWTNSAGCCSPATTSCRTSPRPSASN